MMLSPKITIKSKIYIYILFGVYTEILEYYINTTYESAEAQQ